MILTYAVRHKPTGNFMRVPTGKGGRGSSYWEPTDHTVTIPRLFHTKNAASSALTQWLRGTHVPNYTWESDDAFGPRYQVQNGTNVQPVPSRSREDMEVVIFELKELV